MCEWIIKLQIFCCFTQIHLYRFFHTIRPIPLSACYFYSESRFCNQIVKSVYQSKTRKRNLCDNNTRLYCPYQFQRSMVVKTLWNRLQRVMKTYNNTSPLPQYQNQNNNKEKTNIMMQICDPFHIRSCWILKQHLPCHRCICLNSEYIPYHRIHSTRWYKRMPAFVFLDYTF